MSQKNAVCVIVKNEEKRIKEWICYYVALGFDTIFVYDNNSTDQTASIVKKLSKIFDVRYRLWERSDFFYQVEAYNDCIHLNKTEFRWIAFLDSDEFLVPYGVKDVKHFLRGYDDCASIVINWAMFGSSGHIIPPKGLTVENFVWRATEKFYNARHVKSIVFPRLTKRCINPHVFEVEGRTVNVLKQEPSWEVDGIISGEPIYKICQVNHYYTKSRNEWIEKIKRGYNDLDTSDFDEKKIMEGFNYADHNDIFDISVYYNLENLKKVLEFADIYEHSSL